MTTRTIRTAYPRWPSYDRALREVVAGLSEQQLAIRPTPDRWPIWASIGHLACQRISGLCGQLGEPGAESTPFPDALYRCPGDEYLEPVMNARELVDALASTFRIVEHALDTWTFDMLDEVITRDFGGPEPWVDTRGGVIQRSFAHDVSHITELNETLSRNGLRAVDLWE